MNRSTITRRMTLIALLIGIVSLTTMMSAGARRGKIDERSKPGLFFVDYRHLNGGKDGVLLLDLDPESPQFGTILQNMEIGAGVLPHHLYFDRTERRLYTTALGGSYLYALKLAKGRDGVPRITRVVPIDTGGNQVGEDMYFTEDNKRFYMTFMGGQGGDPDGTVGLFDARSNKLLKTIAAPGSDSTSSTPFIMHPHGISANEALGKLMVTNTAHPTLPKNIGNSVTEIDMRTNEAVRTYLVAESPTELTNPVEVLLTRGDLPPFALVSTVNGGDIWVAPYDAATGQFGLFVQKVDGAKEGLDVALEFYIHTNHHGEKELYVSFGVPGVVKVYSLDRLPELPLKRTLPAGPGAHHMAFFETTSGREVMVIQNNLLNIPGLNGGTMQVIDTHTGEVIQTLDLAAQHSLMPEAIESAFGHGADVHH